MRFSRLISRNPVLYSTTDHRHAVDRDDVFVPYVQQEAFDYESVRIVCAEWAPNIILLLDHDIHNEIKTVQVLSAVVSRALWERGRSSTPGVVPLVLVSGETGRRHLRRKLQRRLIHYSALPFVAEAAAAGRPLAAPGAMPDGNDSKPSPADGDPAPAPEMFPSQKLYRDKTDKDFRGDSFIDVLDDPTERLVGAVQAHRKSEDAAEVFFCDPDAAGAMAANLSSLAGFTTKPRDDIDRKSLCIANARFVSVNEERFHVRCFAHLTRYHAAPTCLRIGMVSAKADMVRLARVLGLPPGECLQSRVNELHPDVDKLKPKLVEPVLPPYQDSYFNSAGKCCGMHNCPIEPFHKLIEGSVQIVYGKAIESTADDTPLRRATELLERFTVNRSIFGGSADSPSPRSEKGDSRDEPRAFVRVTCRLANQPGTFGVALNVLLFRDVIRALHYDKLQEVFNVTYASAYECHDERFGVFNCFGYFTRRCEPREPKDVVTSIKIRPITHVGAWHDYVSELHTSWRFFDKPRIDRDGSLLLLNPHHP